MKAKFCH